MVLSSCFVTVFGRCNVYLRCAYIVTYIYVFVKLHTQHNDVFIRFYFLSVWACSIGHVAQAVQRPAPCPIVPAWPVWYLVQTGAACPAFGRGLPCIWHGPCCCLSFAAVPGALGPPGGNGAGGQGGGGESRHHRKNKKRLKKNTPPPLPISKISAKTKKDPYKGSVFCAILALQALKGRNLQWLKVK